MPYRRKLLWMSVATACAYWFLEAAIHHWILEEGTGWAANLLPRDANEFWMRVLISLLLIAFGAYADRATGALLRAQQERQAVQAQLDDALTKVLRNYIPICAHCKAIRDGERWVPLESYVTENAKILFSHGLCPKCLVLYE